MKIRMRDGTGTIDLKFLVEDVDRHGNVRIYFRRRGRKVRIRATPGTDEFMAEYRLALEGGGKVADLKSCPARGSLRWLVEEYYKSATFKKLEDDTRRVRRRLLDALCVKHGAKPYALMEARHIRKLREDKAETPEAANSWLKGLRAVFSWAVEAGQAERNPAKEVPYIRNKTSGFHTWSVEEIRQYEARHPIGTKARLALALLLYVGVRRADVVKLGRQMERDGHLVFTAKKGKKPRDLPILPELRAVLDATPSGHLTYLVTEFGKPFTPGGFYNKFKDWCVQAGLPHCTPHGLRKGGATIAAENGATEYQLMAIYGWESPKVAAIYTKAANRKRLAASGMALIVPTENESVPPDEAVKAGGTMKGEKS